MKDSQLVEAHNAALDKYIKANNERFSTKQGHPDAKDLSISRRIMKDSQLCPVVPLPRLKYIKANNERFSTLRKRCHLLT